MKKIYMYLKTDLSKRPPVQSLIKLLSSKFDIELITTERSDSNEKIPLKIHSCKSESKSKLIRYLSFSLFASKFLNKTDGIHWILSGDAAVWLTPHLLIKRKKIIVSLYELYEDLNFYKLCFKSISKRNDLFVVCPDFARAAVLKNSLNLNRVPYVIHNKYSSSLDDAYFDYEFLNEKQLKIINEVRNKKVILYQGGINKQRPLEKLILATSKLGDDWHFLIMGGFQDEYYLSNLLSLAENVSYLGYLPSPQHLAITKIAHIGILSYDNSFLNNMLCAPNKIFEYSKFGIPFLANDCPNLQMYCTLCSVGEIYYEYDEIDTIVKSIRKIDENYQYYSERSLGFWEVIDSENQSERLLESFINS